MRLNGTGWNMKQQANVFKGIRLFDGENQAIEIFWNTVGSTEIHAQGEQRAH